MVMEQRRSRAPDLFALFAPKEGVGAGVCADPSPSGAGAGSICGSRPGY